ncbi:MAG: aldo/keto reductase [Bryobacteraceae bacterium]
MKSHDWTRRQVLGGAAAFGILKNVRGASSDMPYRTLGRTGEKVSALGLGGYHIGKQKDPQESVAIVRSAVDRGINFLDNCWDYNDGQSEFRMGLALRDGYRQKVLLMSKIDGRTKAAAVKQIDESLRRLETDHVDLMQLHEVIRFEDPDRAFAPGGAIEGLLEAKKAGKVRYIGFTGHKDPAIHLRMLEIAAQHDFRFDAVQMPLNVMDAHFRSFEKQVVPLLVKQGIGVLGMKSMADGRILESNTVTPVECLYYALNLPTSVVIAGCDSMKILDQAIDAARTFKPLSKAQVSAILAKTAEAAKTGKFEPSKTTSRHDGTARNPQWLG